MAKPVSLIPSPISDIGEPSAGTESSYSDYVFGYDFALDGIPFVSAASPDTPIRRKSVPAEKPRTDNSPEPGEHTFGDWWVKAQSSMHGGAGLKFTDTSESFDRVRFWSCDGVDVWDKGRIKLLPTMKPVVESGSAQAIETVKCSDSSAVRLAVVTASTTLTFYSDTLGTDGDGAATSTTASAGSTTMASNVVAMCSDGAALYVMCTGGVYKVTVVAAGTVTKTRIYTGSYATGDLIGYVKQRLIATNGRAVYELDQGAGVDTALPTAKFTHQTSGWAWTAIAEGPSAIYLSGYAGDASAVYKFVLDTSGLFPTLTSGITTAELPVGERVIGMRGYLGSVIGVSTTAGFRLGAFDGSNILLGPLTIDDSDGIGSTSGPVGGYGRFVYAGFTDPDGNAGLAKVDTAMPLTTSPYQYVQETLFAWAPHVKARTAGEAKVAGTASGIAFWGGRAVVLVASVGVYHEQPAYLVPSGTLVTSRVRMGTIENKNFHFLRVRADNESGYIGYKVGYLSQTSFSPVSTLTLASQQDSGDTALGGVPSEWVSLQFTLTRHDTRYAEGPSMSGYILKGEPSVARQRLYQIPVWVFDREFTRTGEPCPDRGRAIDRIRAVESVESAGSVVEFVTLAHDGVEREQVKIEDVDFQQVRGPYEDQGFGGLLTLTLKTVR